MKNIITGVEIDWMEKYANAPRWMIQMDPNYEALRYDAIPVLREGMAYMAVDHDLVKFYFHNPRNETGFCGANIELTMIDGTKKIIKGPWSSRAGAMSRIFERQVVDVTINTYTAGAVLGDSLIRYCKEHGIDIALVNDHGEMVLEPMRNGSIKDPKGRPWTKL